MDIVIDANVLFRILISQGTVLEVIFNSGISLFAPYKLKEEFVNNKQEILSKSKLPVSEFDELIKLLFDVIVFVPLKEYASFLPEAKQILGEHLKDADFVALCLFKKVKFWTYESRMFKLGLAVSTKELSKFMA